MSFPNISCLKTVETLKNKQTPARTKRLPLEYKHRSLSFSKMTKEQLSGVEMNTKYDILLSKAGCQSLVNWCVIGTLITLITPGSAVEIEDSVSINRPIMKNVPDLPGWVRFSPEYVRCFCNLPACVSTGYMCKSSGGGCFSDLLDQANQAVPSNVYRGIHGCLELLTDRDQRNWCQNSPSSTSKPSYKKKNHHPRSLLLCCYRDMCNHADNPETKVLLNETALGEILSDSDNRLSESVGTKQDPALYTESEVWFRAATIAVPICGAVILLALIGLAIKLLRTESSTNSNHKLGIYMLPSDTKSNCEKMSYRHHNIIHKESFMKDSHHHNPIYSTDAEDLRQQTYVPLLIQKEVDKNCDRKNETNAKLNYMQDLELCPASPCEDTSAVVSEHLFHKNTDLHVGRNMILGGNSIDHQDPSIDKIYNKESIP